MKNHQFFLKSLGASLALLIFYPLTSALAKGPAKPPPSPSKTRTIVTVIPKKATSQEIRALAPDPTKIPLPEIVPVKKEPISRSWIPIAGYNSTYKFFAGGGYFFKKNDFSIHTNGIFTQTKVMKVELGWSNKLSNHWNYELKHEIAHGFEPYYGAGSETIVEDRHDLIFWRFLSRWNLNYQLTRFISVGPMLDYRGRRMEPIPSEIRDFIPRKEDSLGFGVFQQYDLRNVPDNPNFGWYQSFTALIVPPLTDTNVNSTFGIFDVNTRFFQQITKDVVLAIQLAAGTAVGDPSYLFTPRLGGTNRLRGYYENRFRGKSYYLEQTEIRFPIWKFLSGVTFLEFGEASNRGFGHPNASTGVGLRVGLPPDYISQIRLDVGFGKDQFGVFFDFGQSF